MILQEEYYKFKDQEINIEIIKKNVTLEIDGNVKINDLKSKEDLNLKIILNDNAKLTYNKFNIDVSKINTEITVNNNTTLNYNQSLYTTLSGNYKINANILGSNNNTYINFYGVSNQKGKIEVEATGKVKENIKNNDMLENVRVMALNDEENIIYPNLLVSSDEVTINHNATLSGVDEDYLFYLMSKGLSKEKAISLIYKGFILNKLDLSIEEKENII
ncbi:MAG: SufD family Fe-S cluster assembly protein [Bacilli bacterium]|nr:SufD family Fe-S cluster assembly protein [Bacilli bacterium]